MYIIVVIDRYIRVVVASDSGQVYIFPRRLLLVFYDGFELGFGGWQKPQKSDHWIIYVEMCLNVDKELNVKNQFNLYSTANNFVDKIWTAVDNL